MNGVFPHLAVVSEHDPRSEAGIGALIPWADRLWAVGYVAHIKGSGLGLYEIDAELQMRKHPASVTGTFANRMVHDASVQAIIGPHIIDADGNVRTFDDLAKLRLAATMEHLTDAKNKVYFLTMEGLFFEADVHTLESTQLFDLVKVLELPNGVRAHFKSAFTSAGRVVVANNSYHEAEHRGTRNAGRLAEWDGREWTIIERKPFVEVAGKTWARAEFGSPIYATGWDRASVLLKLFVNDRWHTYRLPRGSNAYDHAWNTEWMRIREAQTERYLMDIHGLFYELPSLTYEGKLWGIQPVARHLRLVPDFCSFRGLLVLAGDQTDQSVGQPQSGLWMGHLDELWRWGKPQGWGGPWWEDRLDGPAVSDPFLMTGFDKKVLHLTQAGATSVTFAVEIDFLGNGTWQPYRTFTVPGDGYVHHEFPDGFSAHWVRIRVDKAATVTAQFVYS
ncbi:MAG: hypothetical protein GEU99_12525 [Luteitalea sp.]|nr:hypothetical protein [Luteitalea sp.]